MTGNTSKSNGLVASLDALIEAFSYPAERGLLVRNVREHAVHARADRGNVAAS
jgi:hypothetical protein